MFGSREISLLMSTGKPGHFLLHLILINIMTSTNFSSAVCRWECVCEGHYLDCIYCLFVFDQFFYDWWKMSLSLHQQAHYLLPKVTAVTQAILLTVLSLFSPLCLCLSPFFFLLPLSVLIGANYTASVLKPPWSPLTLLPALMSTLWLRSGRNYPTFSLQSGKKKSNTAKCRAWLFFKPCAVFRVWLLLLSGETQGHDSVDKTLRGFDISAFLSSFFYYLLLFWP